MALINDPKIKKSLVLGNEAVVRGALESGLSFATTYPGTPASEIGDTFAKIAKEAGFYFEYSTNEKVALEAAAGAAFSGLPTMVSMKHYGLNVALDSLLPLVYLECPLVVAVTDDPGSWSSIQTEQDSRWFSRLGKIPTLEPTNAQEAKEMTKLSFKLAQKYKIPILLRLTTRVSHTRSMVKFDKIIAPQKIGKFVKNQKGFLVGSAQTITRHKKVIEKIKKIRAEIADLKNSNPIIGGNGKFGIITSGVCFDHALEILEQLKIKLPVLKINFSYPFPEQTTKHFIQSLEKILVVEELDPIIEGETAMIAQKINQHLKIYGKNLLPLAGEIKPEFVLNALSKILQQPLPSDLVKHQKDFQQIKINNRAPTLCAGCPHRSTFWAVKQAVGKDTVFGGDIGCYLLGALPPFNLSDYTVAMGAGFGISHGVSKATNKKPVAFIGDSTFFHVGFPALVNTIYNRSDILLIILDNRITAMTGHQPNPGMGQNAIGEATKILKIEEIVKACEPDQMAVVNAYNFVEMVKTIKELYSAKGVSVMIAKGECRLLTVRKFSASGTPIPKFEIKKQDAELEDLRNFNCPAIRKINNQYYIDENLCWGCSVCSQLKPKQVGPKIFIKKQ